ncbi:hypothetical protein HMPREF1332_02067, partial [Enterococcus faecalis ERV31]
NHYDWREATEQMMSAITRRRMAFVSDEQYKVTEGQVVSFARITTTGAKRQSR